MSSPKPHIVWEKTLSDRGSTRGTAYTASNKIISHDGLVHVTWLDTPGTTRVQTLTDAGELVTDAQVLHYGVDNHCGAALTVDADGYIHAMAGSHSEIPFLHHVSRQPWSMEYWWPGYPVSDNPTYPATACTKDGRLHLTYRWWHHIDVHESPKGYRVPPTAGYQRTRTGMQWENIGNRRTDLDAWTKPLSLVAAPVPRGYCQYGSSLAPDRNGGLHMGFHVYDHEFTTRGRAAGYLYSPDGGDTWMTAAGKEVLPPCGPESYDVLEYGDDLNMRVSNITVNAEGRPLLVAGHNEDGNSVLWEHGGTAWERTDLLPVLHSVQPDRYFSMDATISVDAKNNTWIAAQTVKTLGGWGAPDSEVVLLFRPAGTDMWQVVQVSEPDETTANWHPSIERITSVFQTMDEPYLLYTHGEKGTGCETYVYTDIRLVKLGSS